MKRTYRKMSMGALLCFLAVSPVITSGTDEEVKEPAVVISTAAPVRMPAVASAHVKTAAELFEAEAEGMYKEMKLKKWGLSIKAFEYALKGYRNLVEHGKVMKDEVLSICDFSQSSRRKRFYVIDMETKKVLINTWVAHGRNSG
ncbi:MAG TPA: murein L,D-transpeptidase catalytic domain family protein, partial [Niastella sp.]